MRTFDRKFGADFLASVPSAPGVYHVYDAAGTLLYVGKARDLRRRLTQYRTTRRIKKDRKRRALVSSAHRIVWQVCQSELEAALTEIQHIQALRPRQNIASAFPFLYPFIGIRAAGAEIDFCLTTAPEAFAAFGFHGAFRSRRITRQGFFALMRLLRFVGHPTPHRRGSGGPRHSQVYTFRRLPAGWAEQWEALLRGASREALEQLSLRLLEHGRARIRSAQIQEDLHAIERFFDDEALPLAAAIAAAGYTGYPVPQRERDALFLQFRHARLTLSLRADRARPPAAASDRNADGAGG